MRLKSAPIALCPEPHSRYDSEQPGLEMYTQQKSCPMCVKRMGVSPIQRNPTCLLRYSESIFFPPLRDGDATLDDRADRLPKRSLRHSGGDAPPPGSSPSARPLTDHSDLDRL